MVKEIRLANPRHVQFSQRLNVVKVGESVKTADDLKDEVLDMFDVLLGRKDSPINSPYLSLAEVATAYYTRAQEIDALIHEAEREGTVIRGSDLQRFRTGALRSFIEASRKCAELGSRRLTQEQVLLAQREVT